MPASTSRSAWFLVAPALLLSVPSCAPDDGVPPSVGAATLDVLGGWVDREDDAVVAILSRHEDAGGVYYGLCSGSLVAPNLVLTARHCVADNPDGIACGTTAFGATDPPDIHHLTPDHDGPAAQSPAFAFRQGNWFSARAVIPSEGTRVCGNDIALVLLEGPGISSELATPLSPRLSRGPEVGETYRVVGFGANTTAHEGLGVRRELGRQTVACVGDCPAYLDAAREWEGGIGTCIGDSGGPALDAEGRVIGVSSRSDPDCTGSIYTSVHAWADFIVRNAVDAAAAGGYPVPAWAGDPAEDAGVAGPDADADADADADSDAGDADPPSDPPDDEGGRRGSCSLAPAGPEGVAGPLVALALLAIARRRRRRP